MATIITKDRLALIEEHYKELAPHYDRFHHSRYDALAKAIVEKFNLQPGDRLVDFGAGTGGITHLCWKKGGLTKPALAVDPSKESLDIASKLEGVDTKCMTCEEFIETKEVGDYNRFFFCRSFHHISNPEAFLKMFHEHATAGTKLMVIDQLEDLLNWEDVRKLSRPATLEQIELYFKNAGFIVTKHIDKENYVLNKQEYFEGMRHRMYSVLELLSDEEIEQGLVKLDSDCFQYKESVEINVTTIFLCCHVMK